MKKYYDKFDEGRSFACEMDEQGIPISRRWQITAPFENDGAIIAVVEAYTAAQAMDRFLSLRPILRVSLRHAIDEAISAAPLLSFEDGEHPFYPGRFFETIEAQTATKH